MTRHGMSRHYRSCELAYLPDGALERSGRPDIGTDEIAIAREGAHK